MSFPRCVLCPFKSRYRSDVLSPFFLAVAVLSVAVLSCHRVHRLHVAMGFSTSTKFILACKRSWIQQMNIWSCSYTILFSVTAGFLPPSRPLLRVTRVSHTFNPDTSIQIITPSHNSRQYITTTTSPIARLLGKCDPLTTSEVDRVTCIIYSDVD